MVERLSCTLQEVLDQFFRNSLNVTGLKGHTLYLLVKNQMDPLLLRQLPGNRFSE